MKHIIKYKLFESTDIVQNLSTDEMDDFFYKYKLLDVQNKVIYKEIYNKLMAILRPWNIDDKDYDIKYTTNTIQGKRGINITLLNIDLYCFEDDYFIAIFFHSTLLDGLDGLKKYFDDHMKSFSLDSRFQGRIKIPTPISDDGLEVFLTQHI